jgi:hypothetical protein
MCLTNGANMDRFSQVESDYNRHYDPYSTVCPECHSIDSIVIDKDVFVCEVCNLELED